MLRNCPIRLLVVVHTRGRVRVTRLGPDPEM